MNDGLPIHAESPNVVSHGFDWQHSQPMQAWSPNALDDIHVIPSVLSDQSAGSSTSQEPNWSLRGTFARGTHDARSMQALRGQVEIVDLDTPPNSPRHGRQESPITERPFGFAPHDYSVTGAPPESVANARNVPDYTWMRPGSILDSSASEGSALSPQPVQGFDSFERRRSATDTQPAWIFDSSRPGGSEAIIQPATLPQHSSPSESDVLKKIFAELRFTRAARQEWEEDMRKALGNSLLKFEGIDFVSPNMPRVFVANDIIHKDDHHPSTLARTLPTSSKALTEAQRLITSTHFMRRLDAGFIVKLRDLAWKKERNRMFVYLDSIRNTAYLNREYFQNHLQFLPINPQRISWEFLLEIFSVRKQLVVLPPRTEHELSLLLAQHEEGTKRMKLLQEVTGELEDDRHIVSLWSPILKDKYRSTVVLYGFAKLDRSFEAETLRHLKRLSESWVGPAWDAAYFLQKHWPHGFEHAAEQATELAH